MSGFSELNYSFFECVSSKVFLKAFQTPYPNLKKSRQRIDVNILKLALNFERVTVNARISKGF